MSDTRVPRTYFVVVSYAGNLSRGRLAGVFGKAQARRERDHIERREGPMAVVRVFDADRVPAGVAIHA